MPLEAIKPNNHLVLRYTIPKRRTIEYEVEASRPVTTFVLDEMGLNEYEKGSTVTSYYGGFSHRRVHKEKFSLPSEVDSFFYLVIQNDAMECVAVRYAVFNG